MKSFLQCGLVFSLHFAFTSGLGMPSLKLPDLPDMPELPGLPPLPPMECGEEVCSEDCSLLVTDQLVNIKPLIKDIIPMEVKMAPPCEKCSLTGLTTLKLIKDACVAQSTDGQCVKQKMAMEVDTVTLNCDCAIDLKIKKFDFPLTCSWKNPKFEMTMRLCDYALTENLEILCESKPCQIPQEDLEVSMDSNIPAQIQDQIKAKVVSVILKQALKTIVPVIITTKANEQKSLINGFKCDTDDK